ncbi:helix-turn-helix domain-containing protein [Pedobacter frigoris]|uniref:helix-turn-helix domain-containing protein n=1 Tax=Pedobacter frigoris TaxID=2571272 RepID=UPI00293007DA|nr:helix-turn-helix domain-containing protein [Pedobacter frigoris]
MIRTSINEITEDRENVTSDLKLISHLEQCIEKNFRREKHWDFYLEDIGCTICRLNNLTRRYLGKTVYEMIQNRLLSEAIFLLESTMLTIREITFELGMQDPAYFSRCFKKKIGIAPKVWRSHVWNADILRV